VEQVVDLVPFGGVSDTDATVRWPPEFETAMNVLGFAEALETAVQVVIDATVDLAVPVATSAGLALLKLISWSDRESGLRRRDAQDLLYLTSMYERLPFVDVYGDSELLERYDYNVATTGAHLLGRDVREVAGDESRLFVEQLLAGKIKGRDFDLLVDESLERRFHPREASETLLSAFATGFRESAV
jgi:predicted nucleotidyltransferase